MARALPSTELMPDVLAELANVPASGVLWVDEHVVPEPFKAPNLSPRGALPCRAELREEEKRSPRFSFPRHTTAAPPRVSPRAPPGSAPLLRATIPTPPRPPALERARSPRPSAAQTASHWATQTASSSSSSSCGATMAPRVQSPRTNASPPASMPSPHSAPRSPVLAPMSPRLTSPPSRSPPTSRVIQASRSFGSHTNCARVLSPPQATRTRPSRSFASSRPTSPSPRPLSPRPMSPPHRTIRLSRSFGASTSPPPGSPQQHRRLAKSPQTLSPPSKLASSPRLPRLSAAQSPASTPRLMRTMSPPRAGATLSPRAANGTSHTPLSPRSAAGGAAHVPTSMPRTLSPSASRAVDVASRVRSSPSRAGVRSYIQRLRSGLSDDSATSASSPTKRTPPWRRSAPPPTATTPKTSSNGTPVGLQKSLSFAREKDNATPRRVASLDRNKQNGARRSLLRRPPSLLRTGSGRRRTPADVAANAAYVTAAASAVNSESATSDTPPKYALSIRDDASPRYTNVTSRVNAETMPANACVKQRGKSRYVKPRAKLDPRGAKATARVKEGNGTKSRDETLTSNSQKDSDISQISASKDSKEISPDSKQTLRDTATALQEAAAILYPVDTPQEFRVLRAPDVLHSTPGEGWRGGGDNKTPRRASMSLARLSDARNSSRSIAPRRASDAATHRRFYRTRERPTVPEPFDLPGARLHELAVRDLERKRRESLNDSGPRRLFRARPMPDFYRRRRATLDP